MPGCAVCRAVAHDLSAQVLTDAGGADRAEHGISRRAFADPPAIRRAQRANARADGRLARSLDRRDDCGGRVGAEILKPVLVLVVSPCELPERDRAVVERRIEHVARRLLVVIRPVRFLKPPLDAILRTGDRLDWIADGMMANQRMPGVLAAAKVLRQHAGVAPRPRRPDPVREAWTIQKPAGLEPVCRVIRHSVDARPRGEWLPPGTPIEVPSVPILRMREVIAHPAPQDHGAFAFHVADDLERMVIPDLVAEADQHPRVMTEPPTLLVEQHLIHPVNGT